MEAISHGDWSSLLRVWKQLLNFSLNHLFILRTTTSSFLSAQPMNAFDERQSESVPLSPAGLFHDDLKLSNTSVCKDL